MKSLKLRDLEILENEAIPDKEPFRKNSKKPKRLRNEKRCKSK